MTTRIPPGATPRRFADAAAKEIYGPAAEKVAGDDGRIDAGDVEARAAALEGAEAYAEEALAGAARLVGTSSPTVGDFVRAARARAEEEAERASGGDGRLSKADAASLPGDLRLAFHLLRTGEVGASRGSAPRFSERVLTSVMESYGLFDRQALIAEARRLGDQNTWLNREELTRAAEALRARADDLVSFDFSENVVAEVMVEFGVLDRSALLAAATRHDADGNRYLRRSELEAAAKSLTGMLDDLGIVSDLDKTIIPHHRYGDPMPPPYPGIAQLLQELEARDGDGGDMRFVTARTPERAADVPRYLEENGVPAGPIETGTSGAPWIAQPEKVRDISRIFDASPNKRFVLFGDANHRDPEVYREIMERYPGRVAAAFIHRVRDMSEERALGLVVIEDYADAAAHLLKIGVLDEAAARRVLIACQVDGLDLTDADIDRILDESRPGERDPA